MPGSWACSGPPMEAQRSRCLQCRSCCYMQRVVPVLGRVAPISQVRGRPQSRTLSRSAAPLSYGWPRASPIRGTVRSQSAASLTPLRTASWICLNNGWYGNVECATACGEKRSDEGHDRSGSRGVRFGPTPLRLNVYHSAAPASAPGVALPPRSRRSHD